jgi:tellurite resistance protein TerC
MIFFWLGFVALVCCMLALDLGVFNKKDHEIGTREALRWTGVWVAVSLLFSIFIYFAYQNHWLGIGHIPGWPQSSGRDATLNFLTGYIVEKSLSLDNIFVMAIIFKSFAIPRMLQHRVLFWGILGALVMRGVMIGAGAALVMRFSWIMYIFGFFLVYTALKMHFAGDEHQENIDPEKNQLVRIARKIFPVSPGLDGHKFFTRIDGRLAITPLLLVLLIIESTDLLFAVDSIPAIFAITTDPFLIFTSNILAILGLRSLYFALAAMMEQFRHLKTSIIFVLGFVGIKMLIVDFMHIPSWLSLLIILLTLGAGVGASHFFPEEKKS